MTAGNFILPCEAGEVAWRVSDMTEGAVPGRPHPYAGAWFPSPAGGEDEGGEGPKMGRGLSPLPGCGRR